MQAILFIGLQASGKSTFYAGRFSGTHVRINLDMLKTRYRERRFLQTCLETRQPFVVDNTNVTRADRARYIEPARAAGFRVIGYYFLPGLDASLHRNAARKGKACIPAQGIHATCRRLEPPAMAEGFDEIYEVTLNGNEFTVRPPACGAAGPGTVPGGPPPPP